VSNDFTYDEVDQLAQEMKAALDGPSTSKFKSIDELLEVNMPVEQLREILRVDLRLWIMFCLVYEEGINSGTPDFHIWGLKEMLKENEKPLAIAWPRDHAKTTLAKIAVAHLLTFSKKRFCVYISHTHKVAKASAKDIKDILNSPLMRQVFGSIIFATNSDALGDYEFTWRGKICFLVALGVGMQIRGTNRNNKRPDIMVLDDVESAQEGEENKLGYAGIDTWFYSSAKKAMDSNGHTILQIGNFVASKSFLGDNLRSPDWRSQILSAVTKQGRPLWESRWSLEELKLDLISYMRRSKTSVWLCEMLNMPLSETGQLLKIDEIKFEEELDPFDKDIKFRCITVDPAIAENKRYADQAGIGVHCYLNGRWQLAEIKGVTGKGPYELYRLIMEMAEKWHVSLVGIECEGYQEALRQVCITEAERSGLGFMKFVELKTGKKRKSIRISAFADMVKEGYYTVAVSGLSVLRQLAEYDIHAKNNKDDLADTCSYLPQMVDKYSELMLPYMFTREQSTVLGMNNALYAQNLSPTNAYARY